MWACRHRRGDAPMRMMPALLGIALLYGCAAATRSRPLPRRDSSRTAHSGPLQLAGRWLAGFLPGSPNP